VLRRFPIMTVSIAAVEPGRHDLLRRRRHRRRRRQGLAKAQAGSCYVRAGVVVPRTAPP
jgi:hypothetical protein